MNTRGGDVHTMSQKEKDGDIKPQPSGTVVGHLRRVTLIMNIDEMTGMKGRNTLPLPTGDNVTLHPKRERFINPSDHTYQHATSRLKSRAC